jgi:SM-20-related protein
MRPTKVYDGCISLSALDDIRNQYARSFSYGWKANTALAADQGHWNVPVCVQDNKSLVDISDQLAVVSPSISAVWNTIQTFFIGKRTLSRAYINGYTYGTDGYLHRDDSFFDSLGAESPYAESVIIYLNPTWNADWGGETVVMTEGKEIDNAVLPKFGRMLVFDGKRWHGSRPLSRMCHELRTVLVFKTLQSTQKNALDQLRDITDGLQHTGRSFYDHLTGTAHMLIKLGAPDHVVQAGLFHSIYGTEFYKHDRVITREQIRTIIGAESEELVHLFCTTTPRFDTLVCRYLLDPCPVNTHLLLIEYCNLLEQGGVSRKTEAIKKLLL